MQELLPHIVEFAGLERFIDQPLKKYSTGMRSRLGFSIASMGEPDILIVDEALSVGDLEFSARAGEKMQELVSAAKLVIVVTHQLGFVERYCTRVVWLERGTVKLSGLPQEVVSDYKAVMHKATPARTILDLRETPAPARAVPVVTVHELGVRFALAKQVNTGWTPFRPPWKARTEWFWALHNVSFTVNEGDILGIIGRNGAGKSTLCKVLSMILQADHGQVDVNGKLSALLTFGAGFNTQLTGSDNIYLNGMMLGVSKKMLTDLYPEIVQFSGLAAFIDEPVKHYSQGMRVRLGFSIARRFDPTYSFSMKR
jgi:teichoic acid transport system ATP-binding protein